MKILHIVDTVGSDENFFPAANCNQISVTANTTVILYFKNSGDEGDHVITLTTVADKADEVALKMAEYICNSGIANGGIHKFIAGVQPVFNVSTIAYTVGA